MQRTTDNGQRTNNDEPRTIFLILGGIGTALSFPMQPAPMWPSVSMWPLAWVGLTPLLARLLVTTTAKESMRSACIFGAAWFLVAGVWVFRMFDAVGWVLIAVPIGWAAAFGLIAFLARRAGFSVWWSWPLVWIALEFVRSEWTPIRLDWFSDTLDPLNFSWFVLGHPRLELPILAQSADIYGGYGLSLAPFLTSLALAYFWNHRMVPFGAIRFGALLILAEVGYGGWRLNEPASGPAIPVGVVQSERSELRVLYDLTEQLLRAAPQTRIVVWPEESFTLRDGDLDELTLFAHHHSIVLVVGVEAPRSDGRHQNLAYWIDGKNQPGIYAKRQRVPFVETHAASCEFPVFPLAFDADIFQVGLLICYDMDFAWNPRGLTKCGAELLCMPTLDEGGWGGTQHAQHALLPRLRAIENRRPVVQAATSGVSQIIDERGRVLADIPYRLNLRPDRPTLFKEGFTFAAISPQRDSSMYTMWGHWLGPATAVGAAFVVLMSLFCTRCWPDAPAACR